MSSGRLPTTPSQTGEALGRRGGHGGTMRAVSHSDDDRLIRELLAPDVEQAIEALAFWLRRHDTLPVYRPAARAEARRRIRYWEERVAADVPRSPLAALSCAGPALRVARHAAGYHL